MYAAVVGVVVVACRTLGVGELMVDSNSICSLMLGCLLACTVSGQEQSCNLILIEH